MERLVSDLGDDAVALGDSQRCVLLLVEQEQRAVDPVQPHLQQPPHLVQLAPRLRRDACGVLDVVAA
eukprot:227181-Rhodomonas_salina.1